MNYLFKYKEMTFLPRIAIVGRPNVGKSALFNRVIKKRIAIVDEAEGVTRDRLYAEGELFSRPFEVIDTGGIDTSGAGLFAEEIKRQAEIAIEEADSIVMVVDGQLGCTAMDMEVAKVLLRTQKPVVLAVNKVDNLDQEHFVHEFHCLGISPIVAVSAAHNFHIVEMLDLALEGVEERRAEKALEGTKVAVIGRPNVGKSTLVNYLLNEERCIVSPLAGTTRDSIDIPFTWNETDYTLVDTAGVRRKHKEKEVVEKFSSIRTERAIERADICLLMLDAQQGITHQEKRIARMIEEAGKGCILLFNKWDLVKGVRMEHCLRTLREEVHFLAYCPAVFISAQTGRNVHEVFSHVDKVKEQLERRVGTGDLNRTIERAMQLTHPPRVRGKRLRVYYATQVTTQPPRVVCFVNHTDLMTEPYRRYLYNQLRKTYSFSGVPLIFELRGKKEQSDKNPNKSSTKELAHTNEPIIV